MTSKHPKLNRPTNVDLVVGNPLIGASKGVTMAQATKKIWKRCKAKTRLKATWKTIPTCKAELTKPTLRGTSVTARPGRIVEGLRVERRCRARKDACPAAAERLSESRTCPVDRAPRANRAASTPDRERELGGGKGAGAGAMTDLQDDLVGENEVLSNRDKVQEFGDRGQDGKWIQTEQLEDHAANKGRG